MLENYSMQELKELGGREVVDAKGESIGFVELVFVDDSTGRPEWMGIWSGLPGKGPRVIVPLRGDPDGIAVSPEKERAAYQHYGVEPLTERPEGMSGPRFRSVLIEIRTTQRRA